eukprot:g3285.t1
MAASAKRRRGAAYHIILFYNYRSGDAQPLPGGAEAFCASHRALCESLGLTGRVLIAEEGINGTVGTQDRAKLDAYTSWLKASPLFTLQETDFKRSTSDREPFPDLFVKVVTEIINTGGVIPVPKEGQGGVHLSPEEFHAKLQQVGVRDKSSDGEADSNTERVTDDSKETVLIDVRTHKEYMVGRFKGAVDPELRTFAEFPAYLKSKADTLKGKTVLMYCTGGIRCEKASFYLKNLGVDDVYQLRGGIHKYLEKYPDGGNWEGKNFVFDKRVYQPTPGINPTQAVVGACYECNAPFDALDGDTICTVCRDMVLVCHKCRPRLGFQYHCLHHRHLKKCYFTDLSSFSRSELEAQRAELETILKSLGEGGQGKGGALKKTKNRRRTLRKQVAKIDAALAQLGSNSGGEGGGMTSKVEKKSGVHGGGAQVGVTDSRGVKRKRQAQSSCRTCGESTCQGTCWGIWREQKASDL